VGDFWSEMLDEEQARSESGSVREPSDAAERKPRFRLPRLSLPSLPRLRLPAAPRPPRLRLPRLRRPGFTSHPRSFLPPFLRDLPGVAARRWPAMLLAFAVGLASTFWILAGAQLVYRAQATVLITRPAPDEGPAALQIGADAIGRVHAMLEAVLSDESLSALIDRFDLYSESGDAQPAALVAYMRGNVDVRPMPRLAQRTGGEDAMAYGFSFASGDPHTAAAVANALAVRFQAVGSEGSGDAAAAQRAGGDAPAAADGAAPEPSNAGNPGADELALLKAKLQSAQQELARLSDRHSGTSAAPGAAVLEVSILAPAVPPTAPQRTRTVVALAGLLASLVMAAVAACLLELVDPALLSPAQLARCSDAPILGSLPRVA
jgi:hypothetical protein